MNLLDRILTILALLSGPGCRETGDRNTGYRNTVARSHGIRSHGIRSHGIRFPDWLAWPGVALAAIVLLSLLLAGCGPLTGVNVDSNTPISLTVNIVIEPNAISICIPIAIHFEANAIPIYAPISVPVNVSIDAHMFKATAPVEANR